MSGLSSLAYRTHRRSYLIKHLTRFFIQVFVVWNACAINNKTWSNFKIHFTEAYDTHLESVPAPGAAGYHDAAAALSDDDSISSVTNSITLIQQIMPTFVPSTTT